MEAERMNKSGQVVFWCVYLIVMVGCIWAVSAAWEAGWVVGFPIALAVGITKVAFFDD